MNILTYRDATAGDLPFIDALASSDVIAAARNRLQEDHEQQQCEGLAAIIADPNHRLIIAECEGSPVGSFQLSFIPGVSRQGAWRGQIESVRVAQNLRGQGIGAAMMRWAIAQCEQRGCGLVQLTSDSRRKDAHRFYAGLGFTASHTGFKLKLR